MIHKMIFLTAAVYQNFGMIFSIYFSHSIFDLILRTISPFVAQLSNIFLLIIITFSLLFQRYIIIFHMLFNLFVTLCNSKWCGIFFTSLLSSHVFIA